MADKTWKAFERRVARWFGAERNPLSGGNGKHTRSDSLHPTLFIETKHRKEWAILNLWFKARKMAKLEHKIPLVAIGLKHHAGTWFLIHSEDLLAVANQRSLAKQGSECDSAEVP